MSRLNRIPANVDREDRLLAGLTARQLGIVAATAVVGWALGLAARLVVPLPVAAGVVSPLLAAGLVLALGRADGLSLDRLALVALGHLRAPRRLVPAPEGVAAPPGWAGGDRDRTGGLPAPLDLPVRDLDPDGIIDLGEDGAVLLCRASAVNFSLRTEAEQQALVAAFARFLHSVTAPVQVVVRAQRADLRGMIAELDQHPAGCRIPRWRPQPASTPASWLGWPPGGTCYAASRWPAAAPRGGGGLAAGRRRHRPHRPRPGRCHRCAGAGRRPRDRPTPGRARCSRRDHHQHGEGPMRLRSRTRRTWRTRRTPTPVSSLPSPDAIEIGARSVRVGATLCRTLAVVGYPREVAPGWLEPLLTHPAADVALHVDPIPAPVAAERLRRQLARLESSRRLEADKGRLADPELEVAAADAQDLARRLARGEGRLYRVGLYVTVRGADQAELDAACDRLRALLASLLLEAHPATCRMLQGWVTTLPLGLDNLGMRRTFDTDALAVSFPFASAELESTGGVLYGRNAITHGLVLWDRFGCENYNQVILAKSGAGKSYLAKLELLRWLYRGVEVAVVDPEDEYRRLADAVGGTYLRLGTPGVRLNPFDLDPDAHAGADALTRRALFLHTLVSVLLREPLDPAATAAL